MRRLIWGLAVLALLWGGGTANRAQADNFSFTGSFTHDDNVQEFNFTVGVTSTVTLKTLSYAGGTNAAGTVIARGGFDPILALFDSSGALVGQNDDGGSPAVPIDSATGRAWDTFLQATLTPGTYTVAVMEYNNFANGPNLSNGFAHAGDGDFTGTLTGSGHAFTDVSGSDPGRDRDNHWAFDILNVGEAVEVGAPEPGSITLLGMGAVGLIGYAWRRRKVGRLMA